MVRNCQRRRSGAMTRSNVSFVPSYFWWYRASRTPYGVLSNGVSALFVKHGYVFPNSYSTFIESVGREVCPLCNGFGEVNITNDRRILCACSCVTIAKSWETKFDEIGINVPVVEYPKIRTWKGKYFEDAMDVVDAWLSHPSMWIAFVGPTGTGKSTLMRAMYGVHSKISAYITAKEIEQRLWASASKKDGGSSDLIEYLSTVPILYLDDLGQELGREFTRTTLWQIVDSRDQFPDDRFTVLSTNMTKADLWGWSTSIAGRLTNADRTMVIEMLDPDHRRAR